MDKQVKKVTLEQIERNIKSKTFSTHPGSTFMICTLELLNGFMVTGESACADPAIFNREKGEKLAYDMAIDKCWTLFGFLLKERMYREAKVRAEVAPLLDAVRGGLKKLRDEAEKAAASETTQAEGDKAESKLDIGQGIEEFKKLIPRVDPQHGEGFLRNVSMLAIAIGRDIIGQEETVKFLKEGIEVMSDDDKAAKVLAGFGVSVMKVEVEMAAWGMDRSSVIQVFEGKLMGECGCPDCAAERAKTGTAIKASGEPQAEKVGAFTKAMGEALGGIADEINASKAAKTSAEVDAALLKEAEAARKNGFVRPDPVDVRDPEPPLKPGANLQGNSCF